MKKFISKTITLHTGFVSLGILLGVFLFSQQARAEQVYQNANQYTPLAALCFKYDGSYQYGTTAANCNGGTPDPGVFDDTTFFQELYITPGTTISAISLWLESTESNGGNRPVTFTAYLMNGRDKVATSTPISWTYSDSGEQKFNFTPYAVTASTPINGVAFEWDRQSAFPLFDTGKMNLRLTPNRYPPDYIDPGFFSGGYYDGLATGAWYDSISQFSNLYDLAITVYQSTPEQGVDITSPANNSTLNTWPVTVSGTCANGVDITVYDGITYASSTTAFGSSLLCNSNTFSYSFNPNQGYWNISASSTSNGVHVSDGIVIYFLAQDQAPPNSFPTDGGALPITTSTPQWSTTPETSIDAFLLGFSCQIPFFSYNPCQQLGNLIYSSKNFFIYGITNASLSFLSQKPYSYLNDTYSAIRIGLTDQPSNTSTIPIANVSIDTDNFVLNQSFFNAEMFTAIIDQDDWNGIRPYANAFLYLVFALYLLSLINRLI